MLGRSSSLSIQQAFKGDEPSPHRAARSGRGASLRRDQGDGSTGENHPWGRQPVRKHAGVPTITLGRDAQQVSDRIQILSDRPLARTLDDPGWPPHGRGEADIAPGKLCGTEDASGLIGAWARLSSVSGVTTSSCAVSFSTGEASSGAESSLPDSDGPPIPTDTAGGNGPVTTRRSHASTQARHDRDAPLKLRDEYKSASPGPCSGPRPKQGEERRLTHQYTRFAKSGPRHSRRPGDAAKPEPESKYGRGDRRCGRAGQLQPRVTLLALFAQLGPNECQGYRGETRTRRLHARFPRTRASSQIDIFAKFHQLDPFPFVGHRSQRAVDRGSARDDGPFSID